MIYLEFEIERKGGFFIARRKRKTEIRQLAPAKTMQEIKRRVDEFYFTASFEDW